MGESFKDHFSSHAALYARHRPGYPAALFRWLAEAAGNRDLAWDCGTGNGQAARALARHFRRVIATDASRQQIAQAVPHAAVDYRVEPAEDASLEDATVDLVFVSQALHWFDLDRFYAEVRRVLRPSGLVSALTYVQVRVNPAVDAVIDRFYDEVVGDYWPPERRHVEQAYATLPFPFPRIDTPAFTLRKQWRLQALLGYVQSWSAVQRYIAAHGSDPVEDLRATLAAAWGDPARAREVRWPLVVLAGRASRRD